MRRVRLATLDQAELPHPRAKCLVPLWVFPPQANLAAATGTQRNWLLIAACAAVAVVAAGAGVMYFSGGPAGKAATSATAVETDGSRDRDHSESCSECGRLTHTPYSIPAPSTDSATSETRAADKTNRPRGAATQSSPIMWRPLLRQQQVPASVNPKILARAARSRPVTAKRGGAIAVEAPALDAEVISPGRWRNIGGNGWTLQAHCRHHRHRSPARVGGTVTPPKLISSTPPVYPPAAKAGHGGWRRG